MKVKNPFVIYGYEGPETFCDREDESERIVSALENGRNITLLAERRIGKTGLIKHVFHKLEKRGTFKTIYLDIFATSNLKDFTKAFADAIIGSIDSNLEKALGVAGRFFKSFRPSVTIDPITAQQSYSFGIQSTNVEATLKECFEYLASKQDLVIAIDEFQQIREYPEAGTEALLRSYIQFLPKVRFIFAGSKHHLMTDMFASAKRPFYNSTQTIPLDRIDKEVYYKFAAEKMSLKNIELKREVFERIVKLFDGITWYLQMVLNRLFEKGEAKDETVNKVIEELLIEKAWEYAMLVKTLPEGTVRLLKAIAKAGKATSVTSAEFIAANNLRGASSVHLSLKTALENELLYDTESGYVVYDRLFSLWLAR